jgi:hypothetical protein
MNKLLFLMSMVLIVSGCSMPTAPTQTEVASYDFGTRPNYDKAQSAIVQKMSLILKDPDSAKYQCDLPLKGSAWSCKHPPSIVHGCGNTMGYFMTCYINAKNSFGGYVGAKEYNFMFLKNTTIPYNLDIERSHIPIHVLE